MKNIFLFIVLFLTVCALPSFAQHTPFAHKVEVSVGQKTSSVSSIEPRKVPVYLSPQDNLAYIQLSAIDSQINYLTKKIQNIRMQETVKEQIAKTTPADNTRVSIIPPLYTKRAKNIIQKLEDKKTKTELTEKQKLQNQISSLLDKRKALLSKKPANFSNNLNSLIAQQKINQAFELYESSSQWYGNKTKDTGELGFALPSKEIADIIYPTYKLSPKQLQNLLKQELTAIDYKMMQSPGYKSYIALEKEVKKINKTKRDDAILMSIFTLVTTYKFTGITKITAPTSALHWWSKPIIGFYAKKLLNYMMYMGIYTAIDEANLKAVGASFEEIITRFTFLQDNYKFLKQSINNAQKNSITFSQKPLPNKWTDLDEHRMAVRKLYALRFINLYLSLSNASYKYDLALLDLMNIYSTQPKVFFDFKEFDTYEKGHWNADKKTNYLPTGNMPDNQEYGSSSSSNLIERTNGMINNLRKLPKKLYYKKVYYKKIEDKSDFIMLPVPPQSIIRDKKGILRNCDSFTSATTGENMQIYNGNYYMRIEPVANDKGTFYRGKPKTYVFEDINTKTKECGRQTNLIMA